MNKRQRKKQEKKYLPIIADEFPLLTMTSKEYEEARREYIKFRKRYAYCTWKELKIAKRERQFLRYYYSNGKEYTENLEKVSEVSRSNNGYKPIMITQSLPCTAPTKDTALFDRYLGDKSQNCVVIVGQVGAGKSMP